MAASRARSKFKRYIKELIHKFRFTYEDISNNTGIPVDRLKAINKGEDPTPEENLVMGRFAIGLTRQRGEDTGEQKE